ncbi:Protein CBG06604 [Caenorhabditis briggsae]|uniref:Protein CBG06339 n=2 Tax=Caenorhabditis briggsae TaxID=6238 RepID=G2J6K1_CAEBR|nr:Protein CBG06339 [Caenorhabditis briggsae]XP_002647522.1 Protein CBG06604 [Caenorhabditis briggsae]ULT87857.1 hypothetical protein L3Y34_007201 [Caenorhabditis briggsae]UMM33642.1 hypothetical protein L5515_007042 [Caenorhabditis briggsae]CAP26663.1 Protein CBG06339 [Caenorhabditis briggsae]CAP26886.1 Protein CBG06604 [Caenorhabditis briggsae]
MDNLITIVCLLGIICALVTILLNINLVIKVVMNKSRRKADMHLFYYRFTLDIFFGASLLSYIIFILLSIEAQKFIAQSRPLIVYLALPWSNFAACRSIIALSISAERVIAAYFPITYRSYRNLVPNWTVLAVGIAFGVSEEFVLFNLCSYDMIIPPSCRVFGCAVNKCFYYFWTIHKASIFSTIVILSIMLSMKLFIWNNLKHKGKNNRISKANRLALLDTVTVLVFDFLPSFCGSMWPTAEIFSFDFVGPYNAVGKVTGCAIEAIAVSTLLMFRKGKNSEPKSSSNRRVAKNTKSSGQVLTFQTVK